MIAITENLILLTLLCLTTINACIINGIDFTTLDQFSPWKAVSDDKNTTYMMRLCGSLGTGGPNGCHSNTRICMTRKNDPRFTKPYSISDSGVTEKPFAGGTNESSEIWIMATGDTCPNDPAENLTSVINVKCGKTMGSPEFVQYTACTSYFEWQTVAACHDSLKKADKEVPCYLYDEKNEKFDLTQLIKLNDGYLVDSTEGWQFFINVCRDITEGAATAKCPKGAAACRIHGNTATDAGQPKDKLMRNVNGNLELHYTSNQTVAGCTVKPATTIEFICPKQGGSRDPLLTYDFNCQYKVEWYTEHACAESVITSNTCKITQEDRNIDFDLSPLTHDPASNHPYEATALPNRQFWLNVCGQIGIQCPDSDHVKYVGGCETHFNSPVAHVIGKIDHQLLRYADGALTLTYRGGETCDTKFQRTTVINFICNATAANNGKGTPKFDYDTDCTYFFKWETKYACLNHPENAECRVNFEGKRYDLSPLVRHSGKNWEVLDADKNNKNKRYFINMCNDLLIEGDAARCHPDASVCMIDDQKNVHNLGAYTSNPVYINVTQQVQITFSNGDPCSDNTKKKRSIVTFICKPGDLESGPVFLRSSLDECIYEFEWYTAAACALSHSTGENCRVYSKEAGINFDLSKLTKPAGQYYNVTTKDYSYLLNVCDKVIGVTSCGTQPNPGVCQISNTNNKNTFNTGQANTKLQYYDGFINLTYTDGDAYHSKPPHPRTTEIAFLCDRNAGVGTPEYVKEDHGYYFKWFTSYACPNPPVECTVTDTIRHQQYDLSKLTKSGTSGNWEVLDSHNPQHKTKYYINVCRPVTEVNIGKGCGTFAAVCQSKFSVNGTEIIEDAYANQGEVINGPKVVGEGRLYLQYKTTSKLCTEDDGTKAPFRTTMHFICSKRGLNKGPNVPIQIGNCEKSFIWETEAACPLEIAESDKCTVKDPNLDYTYNFHPLTKKGHTDYYTVVKTHDGVITVYRINICGYITSCDKTSNFSSSMCEVKNGGKFPGIANLNNYKLYFSDDGQLTLNYYGARNQITGRVTEVIIVFLCNRNVEYGVPIFEREEEDKYYFNFPTSLACKPQFIDCEAVDIHGNKYDLTNLAKLQNWNIADPRPSHRDITYHINVCRPINLELEPSCPGGPIGGCQTAASNGKSFNMGYLQSRPVVIADGTLVLRYRNGDICHRGTPQQAHRSTRITFMCSLVEHDPVFEGENEECEYSFHWMTPHACVQTPTHSGTDCKVIDPLYNYEFDLSALKRDTDYNVTAGPYKYLLNVCQGLKTSGTGCPTNSASCQTKPTDKTFYKDAGHINSSLVYDEGEITLSYIGGQDCHQKKYKRKTIITFSCDQSVTGTTGPYFVNETSECIYQFIWPTKYACPPFKTASCSVHDNTTGQNYDLSSLSMTATNYEDIDYTEKKKYIFNVCRSLVHNKGQTCPFNSAVCKIDLQTANLKQRYKNLGEVNPQQIIFENGKVELNYTNGDLCEDGKTKMSTRIIFYCSPSAKDSHPSGHFKVGQCEHHFVWSSEAGCPITETVGRNCSVKNTQTGHIFDLSPLTRKTYSLNDNRGHTFNLHVCKALPTTQCDKKSGACQVETTTQHKWNAGNANANLTFDDGVLVLNYGDGTPCHHNKYHRNTVINFVCKRGAGEGTPTFIDESEDCTYFIYWQTELACEEKVLCSVDLGNKSKDLSPLIKASGHHLALSTSSKTNNQTFYINICEPLNPIYGTLCPPGSSACYVKPGSKPVSLGKLKNRPYKDKTSGKIVLEYNNGSPCPSDHTKNASTKIIFTCNPGPDQGQPIFESVSADCVYTFLWDTNVVCDDSDREVPLKDCTYKDSGRTINLKSLQTDDPYQVTHTKNGKTVKYLVNVCDKVKTTTPGCGTSSICKVDGNKGIGYGSVSKGQFVKTGDMLQMTFKNGPVCQGTSTSEGIIQFSCDPTAITAKPEIQVSFASQCQTILSWKTPLVCTNMASTCSLSYGGHIYDLSILSRKNKYWSVKDAAGNEYWLNICEGVHSEIQTDKCTPGAAACRKTPHGIIDTLGLISTQTLKMDVDGKTIILEYSDGNSACSHTRRRSDNRPAKIIIKFECGNTVGGPVYISGNENCIFVFKWKSHVACRIQRQEVEEKNNTIIDPRSGGKIDMNKITVTSTITYEKKTFYIDTRGKNMGQGCTNAVVCLHTVTDGNDVGKIIGHINKKKFYIEDEILQAEYASDETCEFDSSKKVRSIIQFKCNHNNNIGKPIFLDESRDCVYLFVWETQYTCLTPNVVIASPTPSTSSATGSKGSQEGGGVGSGKVGIIVAVFLAVIIICVLLIVFHKAERRAAFKTKVLSIFNRDGRERALYSVLPSAEEDAEDNDNDEILILANEEQISSTSESTSAINMSNDVKILNPFEDADGGYHDDSDEDMLA